METSIVIPDFVDARIGPRGSLENLSQQEIEKLRAQAQQQVTRQEGLAARCRAIMDEIDQVVAVFHSGGSSPPPASQ